MIIVRNPLARHRGPADLVGGLGFLVVAALVLVGYVAVLAAACAVRAVARPPSARAWARIDRLSARR